jgi:cellulose synthase/poly-beta-1,6-N-acetylglucosamine synthase-like glycosyltransferase
MNYLGDLVSFFGFLLCLPSGFLLLEVIAGLVRRPKPPVLDSTPIPKTVLLIPAHDEEAVLENTLVRLAEANVEKVRTIIIADNCTDATKDIGTAAGIEVWERTHDSLRGKPHALTWALERLAADPPEVIVCLDADCWFERGSPALLAQQVACLQRPAQAINCSADPGLRGFAFRFRNEARLRGLAAFGAPSQITGSGFAVSWAHLQAYPVPLGELAEDACWGWAFTRAGIGPALAPSVEVLSHMPTSKRGIQTQLRRWEHGILSASLRELPALARSAFFPPRPKRMLHLFDIMVPPLALLGLLCLVVLVAGLGLGEQARILPVGFALSMFAMAVLLGWWGYGRKDISFYRLLTTPFYALGKIGVYSSFLFRRQKSWDRTDRDKH